jgi:hypothetical protein
LSTYGHPKCVKNYYPKINFAVTIVLVYVISSILFSVGRILKIHAEFARTVFRPVYVVTENFPCNSIRIRTIFCRAFVSLPVMFITKRFFLSFFQHRGTKREQTIHWAIFYCILVELFSKRTVFSLYSRLFPGNKVLRYKIMCRYFIIFKDIFIGCYRFLIYVCLQV